MEEGYTVVWSFRNRLPVLLDSVASAHRTCPESVNFYLVDAASDEETILGLRSFLSTLGPRTVRVCEATYRSSLAEAWNLGMMLTRTRYVIFASSDVLFLKPGWFEALANEALRGRQYVLLENHAVFLIDKKAIPVFGWFDEEFVNGPHFDCDYMIRASETGVAVHNVTNEGFYAHGDKPEFTCERLAKEIPDRLPMHGLQNEIYFKQKWQSSWPGWAGYKGQGVLPHPPTNISAARRLLPEGDPHPYYTEKFK